MSIVKTNDADHTVKMPELFHLLNYLSIEVVYDEYLEIAVKLKKEAAMELFGADEVLINHSVLNADDCYVAIHRNRNTRFYKPTYHGNDTNMLNTMAVIACGKYGMNINEPVKASA